MDLPLKLASFIQCRLLRFAACTVGMLLMASLASAEGPQIILASPLVVAKGGPATVALRGLKLDEASVVIATLPTGKAEIIPTKKEKTGVPDKQEAYRVGDTQVEFMLDLAADFAEGDVEFVVKQGEAISAPYRLKVLPAEQIVKEQEPNGGFRQSQALPLGLVLSGAIQNGTDVDVFSMEVTAGQNYTCEVTAGERGSWCDPLLTLYSATGEMLATAEDTTGKRSAVLKWPANFTGKVLLVMQDATDRGGPSHPYLLQVRAE